MDGLPIFFIHKRIGKDFKKINIIKFRTMKYSINHSERFDLVNESRITLIGKYLRKYKLDELPQLVNVFKGDLSVVGPRPEVEDWILKNKSDWRKILSIRPGLTDLASIEFSEEEEVLRASEDAELTYELKILPRKMSIYKEYVDKNNFFLDIVIIFKTIFKIIKP